jgi:hypothetical protein
MYKCSITNKKKKSIKEEEVRLRALLYKKETSSRNPKKPGKLIWFMREKRRNIEKMGNLE